MSQPARQAQRGWARLAQRAQRQVQTIELQIEQGSSCDSRDTKLPVLNSRLPASNFHSPLISMQKMCTEMPSREARVGSESSPRFGHNWHSTGRPFATGAFFSEHGSHSPSAVAEQQNLWKRTWQSQQQAKGLYCSWCGLRHPPQAVFSTPFGFFRVFLLFFRFMYSSNSRLSLMLCACSGSMLPCCSRVSRLAKQLRKSISVFCRAILRFLRMRQATQRSSTASEGRRTGTGSLAMRAQTFATSSLMRALFCFMRESRKAISVATSERCSDWPERALNWRCFSWRAATKGWRRLTRKASSSETSTSFSSAPPPNTARQCRSPLSTSTTVCAGVRSCRTSSTQRKSSSKGAFPAGSTSPGVSITSRREGTSSSRMLRSACCSCSSIARLQYVSISSRQNFSSRSCFCTSLSKTPNCGERRSVEKIDSRFWKAIGSGGRFNGLGDFRMRWVLFCECFDSDSSPELFYSPSRISKDIQNYYAGRTKSQNRRRERHQPRRGLAVGPRGNAPGELVFELQQRSIMGRASKKEKEPSSEEEEHGESEFEEEDEDAILAAHPEDELNEAQRNEELLEEIKAVAGAAEEGEQLTWNAIYALKKQEGELSAKMEEEIQAIRERYELLKQPLFQQISQAALGVKLDNQLYRPEGLPCRGDPTKTAPKAIPDFWGVVFEKEGLISNEVDVECFSKVKELTAELLDHKTNHLRIKFRFSAPTQYFSNLQLQVETKLTAEGVPAREIKEEIKYKGERKEDSVFTMLFDSKTEPHESYGFANELYKDYTNALYFYFMEDEEGEEGEDGEDGEEDGEEDEDSEEVQAVQKPKKKGKEDPKKEIEKPECKQQ